MSPLGAPDEADEPSEAERRRIALRYRERRDAELAALARAAEIESPLAVGEFSTVPLEDFAAIPLVGAAAAAIARLKGHRHGLPNRVFLAVDDDAVHAIERHGAAGTEDRGARVVKRWERGSIRVGAVRKESLKTAVDLHVDGADKPLILYTTSLQLNPWSAEVVRLLGGEVPRLLLADEPAA